jgi:hypothetical protein
MYLATVSKECQTNIVLPSLRHPKNLNPAKLNAFSGMETFI